MRYKVYKESDPWLLRSTPRNWYVMPIDPDDGSFELFATHSEALERAAGTPTEKP
jgi:hypothetical protein